MRHLATLLFVAVCAAARTPIADGDKPVRKVFKPERGHHKLLKQHPDLTEMPDRRNEGMLQFHDQQARYTALVGPGLTYQDPDTGEWKPLEDELYETRNGWAVLGGAVEMFIRDTDQKHNVVLSLDHPTKKQNFNLVFTFPKLTYDSGTQFKYQDQGLNWTLEVSLGAFDIKSEQIGAKRGKTTVTIPYRSSSQMELTNVSPQSYPNSYPPVDLKAGDEFFMSHAIMVGANGKAYACDGWKLTDKEISFVCDDSWLEDSAFPYFIDPSVTASAGASQVYRYDYWDYGCYDGGCGYREPGSSTTWVNGPNLSASAWREDICCMSEYKTTTRSETGKAYVTGIPAGAVITSAAGGNTSGGSAYCGGNPNYAYLTLYKSTNGNIPTDAGSTSIGNYTGSVSTPISAGNIINNGWLIAAANPATCYETGYGFASAGMSYSASFTINYVVPAIKLMIITTN